MRGKGAEDRLAILQEARKRHYINAMADKLSGDVLVSVKDLIVTKGMETTACSRILKGWIPEYDATAVSRIRKLGAVIAKTNCDEFGFGSFNLNSAYGIPENPVAEGRVTGGSSGGSAALTAIMPDNHVSLATSTGGSIENPSAFCSVIGFVPSYGAVSRFGLISYLDSLDRIGIIGKDIGMISKAFDAIRGPDSRDGTAISIDEHLARPSSIAVIRELEEIAEPSIRKAFWKVIDASGMDVEEISLDISHSLEAYYVIAMAEASTNLARYCGLRYGMKGNVEGRHFDEYFREIRDAGFGDEAKRRIVAGTFIRMRGRMGRYYLKAMGVKARLSNLFRSAFSKADVLANPTMPVFPPKIRDVQKLKPVEHYRMDVATVPLAMSGLPHISLPLPTSLPSGITFTMPYKKDLSLLSFAQEAMTWM